MRLKEGLILRKVAGQHLVVPIGSRAQISPVMHISASAAWLWEHPMQEEFTEDSLVEALLTYFSGVTEEVARADVHAFLELLDQNYMLDNGKPDPVTGTVRIKLDQAKAKLLGKKERST